MEGFETSAYLVSDEANLPVLQDDTANQAMSNWMATQRDFVILGGENEEVDRYNFTMDSLEINENREMVHTALVDAAEAAR
jgi:hypothetical protein